MAIEISIINIPITGINIINSMLNINVVNTVNIMFSFNLPLNTFSINNQHHH